MRLKEKEGGSASLPPVRPSLLENACHISEMLPLAFRSAADTIIHRRTAFAGRLSSTCQRFAPPQSLPHQKRENCECEIRSRRWARKRVAALFAVNGVLDAYFFNTFCAMTRVIILRSFFCLENFKFLLIEQ